MKKYCISKTALKILAINMCPLSRHCYINMQSQIFSRGLSCVKYMKINKFTRKNKNTVMYYLSLLLLSWLMAFSME